MPISTGGDDGGDDGGDGADCGSDMIMVEILMVMEVGMVIAVMCGKVNDGVISGDHEG